MATTSIPTAKNQGRMEQAPVPTAFSEEQLFPCPSVSKLWSWSDASSGAQLSFHIGSASKDTLIHLKTLANLTSLSCLLLGMLVACCLVQTTKDAHRMSLKGLRWANSVCLVLSWVNRWFFLISSHDRSRKENLRYACPPALLSQAWKQILPLHAVGRVREAFHPGCSF